jgi:hypothetical protein
MWSHVFCIYDKDTIFESTIDFEPFPAGFADQKRMDNGVQLNYIEVHKDSKYAMLMKFPFDKFQRETLKFKMDELVREGKTYPIGGLLGSLFSYWLFGWGSNPFQSKNSLYCSAAVQEVYSALSIDFDLKHTARNTSPEIVSQFTFTGMEKTLL